MLLKALVAFVPVSMLLGGAVLWFSQRKTLHSSLQLAGAAALTLVVLAHICEALHWFPTMQWGLEHSAGHYFDLGNALLGLTLFPLGYVLHAFRAGKRRRSEGGNSVLGFRLLRQFDFGQPFGDCHRQ